MIAVTAPMKATNNLICHTTASVCLTHRLPIHTTLLSATCERAKL